MFLVLSFKARSPNGEKCSRETASNELGLLLCCDLLCLLQEEAVCDKPSRAVPTSPMAMLKLSDKNDFKYT